jgi:hypothetical protein
MLTKRRTILFLVQLSMVAVLFDGLIGLDIFINTTFRFAFVLSIIWIAKLALVAPLSLREMPRLFKFPVFLVLGLAAFINSIRGLFGLQSVDAFLSAIFFYLLIFIGGGAGYAWSSFTNRGVCIGLSDKFINAGAVMLFFICSIYFLLYILQYVSYFGLGVQTYIITAALLSSRSTRLLLLPVIATIMTGKRGLLIVLGAQYSNKIVGWKRRNGRLSLALLISLFFLIGYFSYQFDLLVRFQPIFDVSLSDIFDYQNAEAFHRLYLATSGRSNEVFAFFDAISFYEIDFWVGYPADFSFSLEDVGTGEIIQHHYFHISPFNYLKHFGVIIGMFLLLIQIRVLIFAMKYGGARKDIGLLLYVGYFFAMFFGAIVIIDILFWVSFSYSYFQLVRFRAVRNRFAI